MIPGAFNRTAAAQEYRHIEARSEVESATPHRLIQLMMERTLAKISMARGYMAQSAVAEKGAMIGDAIDLVSALQGSLNHKADKRLAGNFDALYDYMTRRLLEANLRNDPEILAEVSDLMAELKEAWDVIADRVNGPLVDVSADDSKQPAVKEPATVEAV